jgi:hypothetical protein
MFDLESLPESSIAIYSKLNNSSSLLMNDGWVNMECIWEDLVLMGSERDKQKSSYRSTKNWSKYSTHVLGAIGEMCFSIVTGHPVNAASLPEGDGNIDFLIGGKTIDVKSTQYWKDPDLKQYPKPKKWVDIYVLCGVDVDGKRAKLFGWATADSMRNAKIVDYGYGGQLSLNHSDLNKNVDHFIAKNILN